MRDVWGQGGRLTAPQDTPCQPHSWVRGVEAPCSTFLRKSSAAAPGGGVAGTQLSTRVSAHPQQWVGRQTTQPTAWLQGGDNGLARDRDHEALGCLQPRVHGDHAPDICVPGWRRGGHE